MTKKDKIEVKHVEQLIIEKENIDFENWVIYRNIFLFVSFIVLNLEIAYFLKDFFKFDKKSNLFIIVVVIIFFLSFYIFLIIIKFILKSKFYWNPLKLVKEIEEKLKIDFRNNVNDKFYILENKKNDLLEELKEKRKRELVKKTFSFSDILKTFFSIFTIPSFISIILALNNKETSEQIKTFFIYYLLVVILSFIIFIGIRFFTYYDINKILKLDEINEYIDEKFNIETKIDKNKLKELIEREQIDYKKISEYLKFKNENFKKKIINHLQKIDNPVEEINNFFKKDIKNENLNYKKLEEYLSENEINRFVLEKLKKLKIERKFDFQKDTRLRIDDAIIYIIVQKKIGIIGISKNEEMLEEEIIYDNKLQIVNNKKILKKIDSKLKTRKQISIVILFIMILVVNLILPMYNFSPKNDSIPNFKEYIINNSTGSDITIKTDDGNILINKNSVRKMNLKKSEHGIKIIKENNQVKNYIFPIVSDLEVVMINFNDNSLPSYNILKYQNLNQIKYLKNHEYTLINLAGKKININIGGNYYKLEANDVVKINLNDGKNELTNNCKPEIKYDSIGGTIVLQENSCEIKNY